MKFEENLPQILVISLGENRNLWKHIDKIYYKSESVYYETYLENKDKYKNLKTKYPAKVEDYINKVIAIYEYGIKENDLTEFMSIIKRGYNKIYRACNNSKEVNPTQLYRSINKGKEIHEVSENEARAIYTVMLYLIEHFDLEVSGEIDQERMRIIQYNLDEGDEIQSKIKSLKESLGDEIQEDYSEVFLQVKDVFRPIQLDNLIYRITYNSMDRRCQDIFGKEIADATPDMVRHIANETKDHKDSKIANLIAAYMKFFLANDIEVRDFISDIKIDRNLIDSIISFSAIVRTSFNICLDEEENQVLFISLLYMYALIEHYKEVKHNYLDTSKEEFYERLKEKEKYIEEKESEINDSLLKYENEINNKNQQILELEEEIKRLKKQNNVLEDKLSKNENNNKEVIALRDYVYKEDNNINDVEDICLEEIINDIKQFKVAVFGGRQSTVNKMKHILPEYRYIGVDNLNIDMKFVENFDYVIVCTNYISHAMYYKLMNNLRDTDVKLIYIDDVNVENVIRKINEYL